MTNMVYCAWISTPQTHNKNKQNWDPWQDVWVVPCTSPSLKLRHLTVDGLRALTSLNTDEASSLLPATENWSLSEVATVQCSEGANDKRFNKNRHQVRAPKSPQSTTKNVRLLTGLPKCYGWMHVRNTVVDSSWKIHFTIQCSGN